VLQHLVRRRWVLLCKLGKEPRLGHRECLCWICLPRGCCLVLQSQRFLLRLQRRRYRLSRRHRSRKLRALKGWLLCWGPWTGLVGHRQLFGLGFGGQSGAWMCLLPVCQTRRRRKCCGGREVEVVLSVVLDRGHGLL
jgi:hypothetical protein